MIPAIMRKEMDRLTRRGDAESRYRESDKESGAIIGFTSAVATYGAFFIPKSYGTSISLASGTEAALWAFFFFSLTCIALTWWFYSVEVASCTTSKAAATQRHRLIPPEHDHAVALAGLLRQPMRTGVATRPVRSTRGSKEQ